MKKISALVLTAVLCLCYLASCGSAHKENEWFSEEKLTNCLVGDLPTIEKDYVNHNGEDIYVSFTSKEREAYVAEVFEYLKSQNFKYLGTRGEQVGTLAGTLTTYYFKPATELSEFYVSGSYKFVYSDGSLDEDGELIFCIISLYDYETKNLEYGTNDFSYNTLITIRYKSEAPLSGFYVLKEEEHEHSYGEWQYDEYKHWREYTCGCELEAEMNTHANNDGDALCDICGYNVGVKKDYVVYCQYYYTNEYGSHTHTQISLDDVDVSILVEISNSSTYIKGDPGSSPTKIKYCIRHYDTDTDPFFVKGDEQYLDLGANFTSTRADVTYSIDYVNSQIVRQYTTPDGEVEEYARLSTEQLNAIKEAFQPVADILEPNN